MSLLPWPTDAQESDLGNLLTSLSLMHLHIDEEAAVREALHAGGGGQQGAESVAVQNRRQPSGRAAGEERLQESPATLPLPLVTIDLWRFRARTFSAYLIPLRSRSCITASKIRAPLK